MVNAGSVIHDSVLHLRNIIASGTGRNCYTSYPERTTRSLFPFVTIAHTGQRSSPMSIADAKGTQFILTFDINVFALNTKDRDVYADKLIYQLRTMQPAASSGTIAQGLHDFRIVSSVNIDEPGKQGIHRKVIGAQYKFYV